MDFTKSDCSQPYSGASVGQEQRSCRLFVHLDKEEGVQFTDNDHIFIYAEEIPQQAAGGLQHSAQVQEEQM